jgi:ADP-heptose:LPS heptosyltransferase
MRLASVAQKDMQNEIKVIAAGGLGDCLMLTPFIRHFKLTAGYKHVVVVTHNQARDLFNGNPYVDRILTCKDEDIFFMGMPELGCDIFSPYYVITPTQQNDGQIAIKVDRKHKLNLINSPAIAQIARFENIPLKDNNMDVFFSEQDQQWAEALLATLPEKPTILVNPQSPLSEKEYPLKLWQQVINQLANEFNILQLGEPRLAATRAVSPMPSIGQSSALFSRLNCVVSIDSFPAHLAHAVGTRAVVLWGPTNPKAYGYNEHINLRDYHCPPCANTPELNSCTDRICMSGIAPDVVAESVRSIVADESARNAQGL